MAPPLIEAIGNLRGQPGSIMVEAKIAPAPDETPSGAAKILIVDDRHDKLLALQVILEDLKQEIFTATSGGEALKLALEHEFAVILLDVNMPGLDGLETAALIRKRKRSAHTPIIFITAYPDEMLTMQGYSLGAVDYILSPVLPEILRTKVRVFIELYDLTRLARRQAEERIALAREQAARSAAEAESRRSTILADASKALGGSLNFTDRIHDLFAAVVPALSGVCGFGGVDAQGRITQIELFWKDECDGRLRTCSGAPAPSIQRVLEQALAAGQPMNSRSGALPSIELFDEEGTGPSAPIRSVTALPLIARNSPIGVLVFARYRSEPEADPLDYSLMEDLASRAAVALDNVLLYQELQRADQQKNEFLAMLGHELRNPLAPIVNAAELLSLGEPQRERLKRLQEIIQRQAKHLTRLVDDLLDVSRIATGKIFLQCAPVQISSIIATAAESSRLLIEFKKQIFTISKPDHDVWLKVDAGRLSQILGNLLNNAAKYTPEGGSIALTATIEDDTVVFRVIDSGVGITQEALPHIFDLFAQGERTAGSFRDGLGVGLTLVRRLVELHGGSVEALSAGRNKGSEFHHHIAGS